MTPLLTYDLPSAGVVGVAAGSIGLAGLGHRVLVPRLVMWTLVLGLCTALVMLSGTEPAGTRMLAVCVVLFFGMKFIVLQETRRAGRHVPSGWGRAAFVFLWVGMRPWAAANSRGRARPGTHRRALGGLAGLVAGGALILAARGLVGSNPRLATWIALPGLLFGIHFGMLALLSAAWEARGFPVGPVCHAPQRARSLREFWGRRWNLPFTEMVQISVRRPLAGVLPARTLVMLVFVLSGVLHEFALSVPAGGGYGGPLAYFLLHGVLVQLEPALPFRDRARAMRVWTAAGVLAPLPILFHPAFLDGCIRPILEMG